MSLFSCDLTFNHFPVYKVHSVKTFLYYLSKCNGLTEKQVKLCDFRPEKTNKGPTKAFQNICNVSEMPYRRLNHTALPSSHITQKFTAHKRCRVN